MNNSMGQIIVGIPLLMLIGAIVWATRQGCWAKMSWRGFLVPALPGIVMVASFYMLAWHMNTSLSGWPTSIGEQGFAPALALHAQISTGYWMVISLITIFCWPIACLTCALVKPLKRFVGPLAVYGMTFVLGFVVMQAGPKGFLYWWWD
jgi:hypothetical protein